MKKIIFLTALGFLAACQPSKDKKAELADLKKQRSELDSKIAALESEVGAADTSAQVKKEVAIYEVHATDFKNFVEIQGKIDAEENVMVNPEAQGVVTAVYVKVGQQVSKGQVLAQMDDKVLKQNLAELQTQLDLAISLYNRQKNLWDQQIGTEVQYISAKTQKEAAERRIATLRSQVEMYKIKSPISGTIDAMELRVGQAVAPGMSGIRVINASQLKAKAAVSETYSGRVSTGSPVHVVFPDITDSLQTTLTFVSKTIDPASRSFEVQVKLPSNKQYRPNMLAVLKIVDYQNHQALTIPIAAIQKSDGGDFVYLAENGKVKKVLVTVGRNYAGKAEITHGLKAGDKVITTGIEDLNEEDAVNYSS